MKHNAFKENDIKRYTASNKMWVHDFRKRGEKPGNKYYTVTLQSATLFQSN